MTDVTVKNSAFHYLMDGEAFHFYLAEKTRNLNVVFSAAQTTDVSPQSNVCGEEKNNRNSNSLVVLKFPQIHPTMQKRQYAATLCEIEKKSNYISVIL